MNYPILVGLFFAWLAYLGWLGSSKRKQRERLEENAAANATAERLAGIAAAERRAAALHEARHHPVPAERLRHFELLVRSFPGEFEVMQLGTELLAAPDPELRLAAAAYTPLAAAAAALPTTLMELATGNYAPELRARAIATFARLDVERLPELHSLLSTLLKDLSPEVRRAAHSQLMPGRRMAEPGALAVVENEGGELSLANGRKT